MLRAARRKIVHQLFERRLGLETEGELSREALGIEDDEYGYYVPSSWIAVPLALRWRPPTSEDVLLDVGSGKGRVALQAARYPLRRILGLELGATARARESTVSANPMPVLLPSAWR